MTKTRSISTIARSALAATLAFTMVAVGGPQALAISLDAPSGVDVSSNNHASIAGINWNAVKSDGQSYAFVKATEGAGWVNPHFLADATAAAAAGLKVGAYHYARPAGDPAVQAADFAAQLALVPAQTLPPVLDLEVSEGRNSAQLIEWIRVFTDELKRLTGRTPMIYTYKYFWIGEMGNTKEFAQYPLWLAAYQDKAPEPVGGWDKLAFWQRSDSGRVAGIETAVDLNLFNGTHSQLDSFAAGNYIDFGGILETLVLPGVDLSGNAGALIAGLIALGAGAAVAPAVIDAAQHAGLGDGASALVDQAQRLLADGAISPAQLQGLVEHNASVGDLALYLDNAQHLKEGPAAEALAQQGVDVQGAHNDLANLAADPAARERGIGAVTNFLGKLFG